MIHGYTMIIGQAFIAAHSAAVATTKGQCIYFFFRKHFVS
jgi:hypothetical protein